MHPTQFEYLRAASLDDAISMLETHGDGAKVIAGGHSLLPIMKLRLAEPDYLIDIGRLPELRGVRREGDAITIGALTTHQHVANDPDVAAVAPLLAETAARVGDRQVRNRGTIGGALAHADAAADYPAAILALEATIVAQGPGGRREIPAREFFVGFLTTALEPAEILTEVRITSPGDAHGWSYQKLANQASGYAIVGVAAVVTLDTNGTCRDARIGITGAAPVAWRADAAEAALQGRSLDAETVRAATALVAEGIELLDDLHGSAEYRRHVAQGLTRRAMLAAVERIRGTG
jgi:aerobic carbon-monoxide dehydrogenase medium subunit